MEANSAMTKEKVKTPAERAAEKFNDAVRQNKEKAGVQQEAEAQHAGETGQELSTTPYEGFPQDGDTLEAQEQQEDTSHESDTTEESTLSDSQDVAPESSEKKLEGMPEDIKTVEDLLNYTKKLQEKREEAKEAASSQEESVLQSDPSLLDSLMVNPEETILKTAQKLLDQRDAEQAKVRAQKGFWKGFYEKYQDLQGFERNVQGIFNENLQAWNSLSLEEGAAKLADAARKEVDQVKQRLLNNTETLTEAKSLGISGGNVGGVSAPAAKPQEPPKPKSMTDQLQAWQNRGKKVPKFP